MKGVFIRVGGSVSADVAVSHLKSLGYENRWRIGFIPQDPFAIVGECTGRIGWCSTKECPEDYNLQEIFIPATKHKHYDLIVAWAANPSQKVWYKGSGDDWRPVEISPSWRYEYDWYIGDRPPKRKIMIGDVEIDAPETIAPDYGADYFVADPSDELYVGVALDWDGDDYDIQVLKCGLVHLNKEAAIAHAKALIKVSGGCVDE